MTDEMKSADNALAADMAGEMAEHAQWREKPENEAPELQGPLLHDYKPFWKLIGMDFIVSIAMIAWMVGGIIFNLDLRGVVITIWFITHTFFICKFINNAKPFSIIRRLTTINAILNLLHIIVVASIHIYAVITIQRLVSAGIAAYTTDKVILIIFVDQTLLILWMLFAILAPIILFIASLLAHQHAKKQNMRQTTVVLQ